MKTKIIYISGNEVFDMTDIRAAFEEVRNTLGLGKDTVLFGVPVDKDNAFAASEEKNTNTVAYSTTENINTEEPEKDNLQKQQPTKTIEETEVKKTKKARAKVSKKELAPEEPVAEQLVEEKLQEEDSKDKKIIPILSVLASKKTEEVIEPEVIEEPVVETEETTSEPEEVIETEVHEISDINDEVAEEEDVVTPEESSTDTSDKETEKIDLSIEDIISDEAPDEPVEKTLEQLLESMTPLREDFMEEHNEDYTEPTETVYEKDSAETVNVSDEDSDATLEQLAAEFAENEDKIPTETKVESHSKIGKLKNILPFKKAKRDDNGLMGDLFGWAGIAANDEDFTIPGFFTTNAASKK